jgi:hypothetical protein
MILVKIAHFIHQLKLPVERNIKAIGALGTHSNVIDDNKIIHSLFPKYF